MQGSLEWGWNPSLPTAPSIPSGTLPLKTHSMQCRFSMRDWRVSPPSALTLAGQS